MTSLKCCLDILYIYVDIGKSLEKVQLSREVLLGIWIHFVAKQVFGGRPLLGHVETDFLIVGTGPAGLTLASSLAR